MTTGEPRNMTPTPREREVLRLVADGLTEKEIARRMGVCANTVHNLKHRACRRLGAVSTTHAVALAIRRGLLPE